MAANSTGPIPITYLVRDSSTLNRLIEYVRALDQDHPMLIAIRRPLSCITVPTPPHLWYEQLKEAQHNADQLCKHLANERDAKASLSAAVDKAAKEVIEEKRLANEEQKKRLADFWVKEGKRQEQESARILETQKNEAHGIAFAAKVKARIAEIVSTN